MLSRSEVEELDLIDGVSARAEKANANTNRIEAIMAPGTAFPPPPQAREVEAGEQEHEEGPGLMTDEDQLGAGMKKFGRRDVPTGPPACTKYTLKATRP